MIWRRFSEIFLQHGVLSKFYHDFQLCCYYKNKRFFSSVFTFNKTIYALSSGHGKCGIAVIRVSGSETSSVVLKMTRCTALPTPRQAMLLDIFNPWSTEHLDKALVLWFPGPNSFTGEDVCEFHVHGGNAVVSSVFRALSEFPGLTHAEPGEYTKRAYMNGKLDLTEVEGLGDLIHAETEEQRKQALKQMDGLLKLVVNDWSRDLLNSLAHLEAFIDFGEDQHIDDDVVKEVSVKLKTLAQTLESHLKDKRRGEILRSGVRLVIIGKPNVGKSSLLNLLTSEPKAIVSSIAGTTRDVIETTIDLDGFPLIVSDTAGIRDTSDEIESEGVRRAKLAALTADLMIHVIDAREVLDMGLTECIQIITNEKKVNDGHQQILFVINKVDLLEISNKQSLQSILKNSESSYILMSCVTQTGFDDFLAALSSQVKILCLGENPSRFSPSLTQERHRAEVANCLHHVNMCQGIISNDVVIAAEHLRLAMNHLGKLTGKIGTEEILDVIFQDFCIGK